MEIPQTSARSESTNTEAACADAIEYSGSAESDCARAIAQAERVLREVSLMAFCARRSSPLSSSVSEKTEASVPGFPTIRGSKHSYRAAAPFGGFDLQPIPDHLPLDPGLDFVVHDDGAIELTEIGFRRMAQAHSAGLDAVIEVDSGQVFRFPARTRDVVDALPARGEKR
jgi:hypothetical protein